MRALSGVYFMVLCTGELRKHRGFSALVAGTHIADAFCSFFCCILFMSLFLPLGRVWSLDALMRKPRREPLLAPKHTYHLSTASAACAPALLPRLH